jgi:hypothetical protein
MKLILFLLLFFIVQIFYSCNKAKEKPDEFRDSSVNSILLADSLVTEKLESTTLKAYLELLQSLDTTDAASSLKAVDGFRKYLAGKSDRDADIAFVIFRTLYDKLKLNLNIKHANDTSDFSPFMYSNNSQITGKLLEYRNKLHKNGFQIISEEGMTYIDQNWLFIDEKFSPVVTRTMKSYIQQLCTEHAEKAFSDAAFLLEPAKYIDRLIWYEKFIYENPDFQFLSECKDTQCEYLTYLFYGVDNTPLLEDDTLSDYFTEVYEYLQQNYPGSKTAKIVIPYFTALQQQQIKKAESILNQYQNESVITDIGEL